LEWLTGGFASATSAPSGALVLLRARSPSTGDVLAPLEVLEYVVVHELCHLRIPNHSKRFWTLVERWRPGWRDERDWLRKYGPELLAFRPAR